MLARRLVPCLDVDRGRVVKGTNFVNLRDAGDPVQVASRYEAEGADEMRIDKKLLKLLRKTAQKGTLLALAALVIVSLGGAIGLRILFLS